MSTIIDFPTRPREPGLDRIVAEIVHQVYAELGVNSLAANRHAEQMYVAGSYAHWFFNHVELFPVKKVGYGDLARLDPYIVAEHVAPDLDRDDQAGIARTVGYLVAHAQKHIDEPAAA
jgi:hypothetical protein